MFVEYTVDVVYTRASEVELGLVSDDEEDVNSAKVDDAPDMTELIDSVPVLEAVGLANEDEPVDVSSTGQTVVYSAIVSVVTEPIFEEHSLAPGAQELIVYTLLV